MDKDKLRDWFLHKIAIGDDTAQRKIADLVAVCLKSASDYEAVLKIKNGVDKPDAGTPWANDRWLFLNANDVAVLLHVYRQCKINFLSHRCFKGRNFDQVYKGVYPDKAEIDTSCWCGDSANVIGLSTKAGQRISVQRILKKLELMGLIVTHKRARTIYRRIPTIEEMMDKLANVAVLYDSPDYPFTWRETQETESGPVEMLCTVTPIFSDSKAFREWVQQNEENCKIENMELPPPVKREPVRKTAQKDQGKEGARSKPAPTTAHTKEASKIKKDTRPPTQEEVYKNINDKLDRLCDGVMDDFL